MILSFLWGTLEDVEYSRKPTTLRALTDEVENVCAPFSVAKITQAEV